MSFMKSKATQKYCPNCGALAHPGDSYCLKCGYSFMAHHEKLKGKGIKWRNIIIALVVIAAGYFAIRYFNHKPIIPVNWQDAISFKNMTK